MSRNLDREYHAARAAAEMQRAEEASDPASAAVHRELAALHKRRIVEIVNEPETDELKLNPELSSKQAS